MLRAATSLGRSGLQDWLLQRVSALIMSLYFLFILGCILWNPHADHACWFRLFTNFKMQIFTLLALISLLIHAWIGIWTVSTDYIKVAAIRLLFQIAMAILLFSYLVFGIQIIWR